MRFRTLGIAQGQYNIFAQGPEVPREEIINWPRDNSDILDRLLDDLFIPYSFTFIKK